MPCLTLTLKPYRKCVQIRPTLHLGTNEADSLHDRENQRNQCNPYCDHVSFSVTVSPRLFLIENLLMFFEDSPNLFFGWWWQGVLAAVSGNSSGLRSYQNSQSVLAPNPEVRNYQRYQRG